MSSTEIEISTDPARIDIEVVHRFLNTSYWAQGRSLETVERSIRNSLCFGAYCRNQLAGFARAVTDRATFAYLADVFVLPEFRGRGIGKQLVGAMLDHPDLKSLPLTLLRTRDAHGLYTRFGFEPPPRLDELMSKYRLASSGQP